MKIKSKIIALLLALMTAFSITSISVTAEHVHNYGPWTDNGANHMRACECGEVEYAYHDWGDWTETSYDNFTEYFSTGRTRTSTCKDCGATRTEVIDHSSVLSRIFYPIYVWVFNLIHKLQYVISLDWFIPWINLPFNG